MAQEETKPSAEAEAAAVKGAGPVLRSKRTLVLGGGAGGLLALAFALALVALPRKHEAEEQHEIEGPFVADISPLSGFQVNLAGRGGKHYLAMSIRAEVDAFDEAYAAGLTTDALHQARMTDAVLKVVSRKTKEDMDDPAGKDLLREELRVTLEPVLFPVHVGNAADASARHGESGLRPGSSIARATMRGLYYEHELELDAGEHTVRLDDGPLVAFEGEEADLLVEDGQGRTVYLDVTGIQAGFHGTLHVGVMGRVRNIYFSSFLTQ
jgi:flagellar basal body-associated protein FliL